MVMEGIAPAPVDQPNIGIGEALTIIVEGFSWVQEHVSDARHRNERSDPVFPLRQAGEFETQRRRADHGSGRVAKAKAPTRQTDLAQHGGQGCSHPGRLFAKFRALQGPAQSNEGLVGCHAPRQGANGFRWHLGDLLGPLRRLGLAIVLAQDIALEALEANAVAV